MPEQLKQLVERFAFTASGPVAPPCKEQEPMGPKFTGTPGVYPHVEAAPER